MAVASLGVTNTIMASVRSRRWQFGILRSMGDHARRAAAPGPRRSLPAGHRRLRPGFSGRIRDGIQLPRPVGHDPRLQAADEVPWDMVLIGVALIMTISLVASLFPALSSSRAEPLKLLQAGRAAG